MKKRVFTDRDASLELISSKTVGVLGYGAQGRSHALNLRDSGVRVVVGQRAGGPNYRLAMEDGFAPTSLSDATIKADIVSLLLPDEWHGVLFQESISPHLNSDKVLVFCHGFSLHYGQVVPPPGVASVLVSPKAAGHRVRSAYLEGAGFPSLIALGPHADDRTLALGLAYAKAIGGTRLGVYETTVAEETETDLFGEQAVLCGGVAHLIQAAFDTLVEAGYQEEIAFFECLYELKLIADLIHRGGLGHMRAHISNTAEYGDYTRGPRIINPQTRAVMRDILREIQSGQFACEWVNESRSGGKQLAEFRRQFLDLPIEQTTLQVLAQVAADRAPSAREPAPPKP